MVRLGVEEARGLVDVGRAHHHLRRALTGFERRRVALRGDLQGERRVGRESFGHLYTVSLRCLVRPLLSSSTTMRGWGKHGSLQLYARFHGTFLADLNPHADLHLLLHATTNLLAGCFRHSCEVATEGITHIRAAPVQGNDIYQLRQLQALQKHDSLGAMYSRRVPCARALPRATRRTENSLDTVAARAVSREP